MSAKAAQTATALPADSADAKPAHSKIGASSMHRWAACPGSVRLSEGIPNRSSKYAEEGTDAHDLAAYRLQQGVYDRHPMANNEEMLEHVETYVNYVEELRSGAPMGELLVEHRFDLSSLHPGLFGTGDAIVYDKVRKILHVIDFKYGAGIAVEVEDNEQLKYYGLGALLSLNVPCDKVVLHIVQPRCPHPKGPARSWAMDALDLVDFSADLVDFALKTEDPFAPVVPGDHCRFCPALGLCPALENKAQEVAKTEFLPYVDPSDQTKTVYDPAKVGKLLEWLPVLESWIKGVRDFAYSEAEHGRSVPGWKLVAKRASREWTDPGEVGKFLEANFTPSAIREFYDPPTLKSVAQLEKSMHKNHHDKLKPFIVAVSSGNTLVPVDDKRAEVKVLDAKSEFTAIEEVAVDPFS